MLIVDDVLATGGTAAAAAELVDARSAPNWSPSACLIELDYLGGRQRLAEAGVRQVRSALTLQAS